MHWEKRVWISNDGLVLTEEQVLEKLGKLTATIVTYYSEDQRIDLSLPYREQVKCKQRIYACHTFANREGPVSDSYIAWFAHGIAIGTRLLCGCEPHGHKCLIAEGGCGRCVEHCICERGRK